MSGELQKPPVVDLELLLQPISEENPSGESLRYSGVYDEIVEARRADDNLSLGEWQTELKVADYRKVIDLAVPALSTRSKDLQISAWLLESLVKQYGFVGLRDGIKLAAGLQDKYWETLYPEIDEGDMEGRANAISWIETNVALAVKDVPITGGDRYSFTDFEDSKTFDIPENIDTLPSGDQERYQELKTRAERERRVTADLWRKNLMHTRRADCEEINFAIDECWAELKNLETVIEAKFDRNQMPGLTGLKKVLETVHGQAKKILDEKRIEEPDEVEASDEETVEVGEDGVVVAKAGGVAGAIQSRRDALKRLGDIADFFQKTEPHSPVSYLVQRAVKWGNMPLENWLQDVIKDESILAQLRQTLGFNTGNGEPPA
jgi:type VI secretion system protein ImpA